MNMAELWNRLSLFPMFGGWDGRVAVIYLLVINLLAFLAFGWDKSRSKIKGAWRISEKRLFLLSLLGGSVGALMGMHGFHHKTKHWYFRIGLPAILLVQVLLYYLLFCR